MPIWPSIMSIISNHDSVRISFLSYRSADKRQPLPTVFSIPLPTTDPHTHTSTHTVHTYTRLQALPLTRTVCGKALASFLSTHPVSTIPCVRNKDDLTIGLPTLLSLITSYLYNNTNVHVYT